MAEDPNRLARSRIKAAKQRRQKSLDLSGKQLSEVPPEIGELTGLLSLDLSNNQLSALPDEIANLVALRHLDLSDNQFNTLPPALKRLGDSTRIDVDGNPLCGSGSKSVEGSLSACETGALLGRKLSPLPSAEVKSALLGEKENAMSLSDKEGSPPPDGKVATPEQPNRHGRQKPGSPHTLSSWGTVVWTILTKVPFAILILIVFKLVFESLWSPKIEITSIAVPHDISDKGFTADVAAQRLRDAMSRFAEDAVTPLSASLTGSSPKMSLPTDQPNLVVPTLGLSVEAVAAQIRTTCSWCFFDRRSISGEIMKINSKPVLRLRKNGEVIYNSADDETAIASKGCSGPAENVASASNDAVLFCQIDDLLAAGAEHVYGTTEPYFSALALFRKDAKRAIETTELIIADLSLWNPDYVRWHNLLGLFYEKEQNFEKARENYEKARNHNRRDAESHHNVGRILNLQEKKDEAIREFNIGLGHGGDHAIMGATHASLYRIYLARDKMKAEEESKLALNEYTKAIVAYPTRASAFFDLGSFLEEKGDLDKAIERYRSAIALNPRYAAAHYNLAVGLHNQGNLQQAIEHYRKVVSLEPQNDEAHLRLGSAAKDQATRETPLNADLVKEGQLEFEHVRNLYTQAITDKRGAAYAYYKRARLNVVEFNLDGPDGAISDYEHSLESSESARARAGLGFARFASGDFTKAAQDLERALKTSPEDVYSAIWHFLARARAQLLARARAQPEIKLSELQGELENRVKGYREEKKKNWPYPVVELFLRRSKEGDNGTPLNVAENNGQKCEANFYIGEWLILLEKQDLAKEYLEEAWRDCPTLFHESTGARLELVRLTPPAGDENPSPIVAQQKPPAIAIPTDAAPAPRGTSASP